METGQEAAFSEVSEILAHYDLGDLITIERNDRGYINTSYAIETVSKGQRQRYFFRRYKSGIQEMEIKFEHSLINHLLAENFSLIARVYETQQGSTYWKSHSQDDQDLPIFYAIFDFLPGEDKYTCVNPRCTLLEIKNSAAVLASFHNAVADLSPQGQRFEPKILELLPQIQETINNSFQLSKGTVFDTYLYENASLIQDICQKAERYFADLQTSNWSQIVIHCDFHPGNLKFEQEEVVGLFDFDWSKIDLRCFDVALGIWYFFVSWQGDQDGVLRVDEGRVFLQEYQSALRKLPNLDPITRDELQNFPMMILLGSLFVVNWAVSDFYSREVDPEDYRMWLRHCVKFIRWFSNSGYQSLQRGLSLFE
jgi:homoserine kinase type II